jgi:hypothetical protein
MALGGSNLRAAADPAPLSSSPASLAHGLMHLDDQLSRPPVIAASMFRDAYVISAIREKSRYRREIFPNLNGTY